MKWFKFHEDSRCCSVQRSSRELSRAQVTVEDSPKQLEREAAGAIKLTCNRWCAILQPCFGIYASWICTLVLAPCTLQTARPAETLLLWCGAAARPYFTPSFAASWVNEMINWRSFTRAELLNQLLFQKYLKLEWKRLQWNKVQKRAAILQKFNLLLGSGDQSDRSNVRIFGGRHFCVVTYRKPFKCSYLTSMLLKTFMQEVSAMQIDGFCLCGRG